MRCPNHPDRAATARCGVCGQRFCPACAPTEARLDEPVCASCHASLPPPPVRARRPWGRLALILLVVAGGLAGAAALRRPALVRAFDALESVGLALEEFRAAQGRYPDRLEELVPDVLAELPRDPFDPAGGPLRYGHAEGAVLLYSLGPDRLDQRGTPRDPATGAGDLPLVVR